jgi:hypothetical protein
MARSNRIVGGDHPRWGRHAAVLLVCLCVSTASAQPGKKGQPAGPAGGAKPVPPAAVEPTKAPAGTGKAKVFDFTGLDISGRLRTPQLLYFLDRANEELERASLERRSFIPEMVRSVDEGNL